MHCESGFQNKVQSGCKLKNESKNKISCKSNQIRHKKRIRSVKSAINLNEILRFGNADNGKFIFAVIKCCIRNRKFIRKGRYRLNKKRRLGDRYDATWVRDCDPMHGFMPYLYINRADNEAFIQEEIDLTALNEFLAKKNEGIDKAHRYTIFHCVACALVKTISLRPKMNYFIKGSRLYSRNDISVAFTIKKRFEDEAHEALAFKRFGPETTIDSFHEEIMKEIFECRREDKLDNSTDIMATLMKLPRFILRPLAWLLHRLDYYGKVPYDLIKADPNYASVFLTNLGSIGLKAGYHHLSNWGTCSLFVIIGEKHTIPVFQPDGSYEMREMLPLGLTLDERIADGYYYSKTVKLFKHIMEHPELLERPACEEVAL